MPNLKSAESRCNLDAEYFSSQFEVSFGISPFRQVSVSKTVV